MTTRQFWDYLDSIKVVEVNVTWEGSGDEGSIAFITGHTSNNSTIDLMDDDTVYDFLEDLVENKTDWCGDNDGMRGYIRIDTRTRKITVEGYSMRSDGEREIDLQDEEIKDGQSVPSCPE